MGRPLKKIDERTVRAMASVGATNTEIAEFFGIGEATVRRRFGEILTKGHASRKVRLRQMQWKACKTGNTALLIWLGKQMLSQTDKQEVEHSGKIDSVVKVLKGVSMGDI